MQLSKKGFELCLAYEVGGGKDYFDKFLARPSWPGEDSGITIGIGYDLGYNTQEDFLNDWGGHIADSSLALLCKCIGATGEKARALKSSVRDKVTIAWDQALAVFTEKTVPKFFALTAKTFPGLETLPEDAQGALVSLVFNRGNALKGDRRAQMREIRKLVGSDLPINAKLEKIAQQLIAMIPLWEGRDIYLGMKRRRTAEATLVRSCIVAEDLQAAA